MAKISKISDVQIRAAASGDRSEIFEVVQSAFERDSEALLVERLQKSEAYIPELSLVSSVENQIVGYMLFTSIKIVADDGVKWKRYPFKKLMHHFLFSAQ
jgi:predicted N-acetyltransferase YhbS